VRLSLSVRIAESSSRKDRAVVPIEELAPLARAAGFDGLSMRASALSVDSPPEHVRQVRRLLDGEGLAVSMVTGNVAIAANTADAPDCLRHITPHLDLAVALGARLVRVMIHGEDDIPHARAATDEAAERGLALAHQAHWGTVCETVDQSVELVRRIGRPNFGITYEPANLRACGGEYGLDAIARLAPHLVNVYFQNVRLDAKGTHIFKTRGRGPVRLDYVALDDPSGIDFRPLIDALVKAGYDGWVSVHQPLRRGQVIEQAVEEAGRIFMPLIGARAAGVNTA
jgi:sugar phosphate isomerase/epimerase